MKKPFAFFTFLAGLAAAGLIAASLGTETWARIEIYRQQSINSSCDVIRTLGLFNGHDEVASLSSCLLADNDNYNVLTTSKVAANKNIMYCVIAFSIAAIFFAMVAACVASYNLFSRPYETWAGPVGLLSYFTIGLILDLVAVVLYLVEGFVYLINTVPVKCADTATPATVYADNIAICEDNNYEQTSWSFEYSYYILIASLGPLIIGIVVVIMAGKSFKDKIKRCCCPATMEEEKPKKGEDNIMMF